MPINDNGRSVIIEPPANSAPYSDLVIYFASVADDIPAWGSQPANRDRQLRAFWPTEPVLASAVFSTASRYSAFGWTLRGPKRIVNIYTKLLHSVERGAGWIVLLQKVLIDLFTQDNGSFIEVVRTSDSETSPMVTLNHLDSNKCIRTGRHEAPVIYYDSLGKGHLLKWYQVIPLSEFPSPVESMRGMQYCAVTRLLRAAQVMRDISVYEREKVSGRFNRAIHLVSGVQQRRLEDAIKTQAASADSVGLARYLNPLVVASLDPTATVKVDTIELAALPDGFDKESVMRWYINQLALAFGGDYQDYAPLPGGNLGTAEQSQTLHLKARGRGPKLFMNLIEHAFNFRGILPSNLEFEFGDQDVAEDMEHAKVRKMRADERKVRIDSQEISPQVARQIAVDYGDLEEEQLAELATFDAEQKVEAERKRQEDMDLAKAKLGGNNPVSSNNDKKT